MDTLTHVVLGACIGEAIAGKKLGKRALFLGAFANSFPDIDFVGAFFLSTSQNLLVHRGITHSILFALLSSVALARFCQWYFRRRSIDSRTWLLLFGVNIFTHILIDACNAYGTAWWLPFNATRVSFHLLFVADPLFTLVPLIACVALTWRRSDYARRQLLWKLGIGSCALYLFWCIISKQIAQADVHRQLSAVNGEDFFTTPTPFNSLLWFVVIRNRDGFYTGYHSVFDKDGVVQLHYHPQQKFLLQQVKDKEEADDVLRFAAGYYTVEKWQDTTVLNVLRFGQVAGWQNPRNPFAFHYLLDRPGANTLVTQRGRLQGWDKESLKIFWRKIEGE